MAPEDDPPEDAPQQMTQEEYDACMNEMVEAVRALIRSVEEAHDYNSRGPLPPTAVATLRRLAREAGIEL